MPSQRFFKKTQQREGSKINMNEEKREILGKIKVCVCDCDCDCDCDCEETYLKRKIQGLLGEREIRVLTRRSNLMSFLFAVFFYIGWASHCSQVVEVSNGAMKSYRNRLS